jgi:hypothetical protein
MGQQNQDPGVDIRSWQPESKQQFQLHNQSQFEEKSLRLDQCDGRQWHRHQEVFSRALQEGVLLQTSSWDP